MKINLDRRSFIRKTALLTAGAAIIPSAIKAGNNTTAGNPVRLGGPVYGKFDDPVQWIRAVKALRYGAAVCPVQPGASPERIRSFSSEAKRNNILISEVGVWNNLFDPDETARKAAINKNVISLQLADEIGACCCVNISGAKGEIWDGPYPGNYLKETFDQIVENVRYIIDQVKPKNTFYTLEPMPFMLPDSPDSYLELIKAIGRDRFAVHLDPVNMISNPRRYFNNAEFLRECFSKLGPYIKSVHAKDIIIMPELTVHLEERRPGLGSLNYAVFLQEMSKLKDIPMMMEHLDKQEEYLLAAEYIRKTGSESGISFVE
jgi:sugar phosphate isomerase/epimerase